MTSFGRRALLRSVGAIGTGALAGSFIDGMLAPLAFANAPGENRFVLVVLRGGLDSMHALVPHGDETYYRLRPGIAVPRPGEPDGAIDLDGRFGLHPALGLLAERWHRRELLIVPAATTGYRMRSHFDAQNQLENGSTRPFGAPDGWLNRALGAIEARGGAADPSGTAGAFNSARSAGTAGLPGTRRARRIGLALGVTTPLVLQGHEPVRSWAPSRMPPLEDDFLLRLAQSYEGDSLLHDALSEAIAARPGLKAVASADRESKPRLPLLEELATMAGRLLASADGPRIATIESDDWDTHTGQPRRLAKKLGQLDHALDTLRIALGDAWRNTVVMVVSEFGRTAAENGNQGTDHGVASLALLAGGAVRGGRLLGTWPGLEKDQLHEGRDLLPTTHYTGLFKGVLRDHLGVAEGVLDAGIFPGQHEVRAIEGIVA